jgi:hypothetical protein
VENPWHAEARSDDEHLAASGPVLVPHLPLEVYFAVCWFKAAHLLNMGE